MSTNQSKTYSQIIICFMLFSFSLSQMACAVNGITSSMTNADASDSNTTSTVLSGSFSAINFSDSTNTSINFDDLSEDEEILLVLYSYSDDTDSLGFALDDINNSFNQSFLTNNNQNITEDFHHQLRTLEQNIDQDPLSPSSSQSLVKLSTLGSTRTFKVIDSTSATSSYTTVTAELRYSNADVAFYVDTRNEDAISDDELEEIAQGFEPNDVRELFGEESDVNNDNQFVVLMSQAVNELGASSGGLVTGFFYAVDLFDDELYEQSNEMEIYYTLVPDPEGEFGSSLSKEFCLSNIYPTVLPHEFQHMISFNQHYILNGGSAEETWLNEALSHLAEDVSSMNNSGYMEETSLENPARVSSYLSDIHGLCFSCGSSLTQRGGSYLFIRYLYEQAELGNLENINNGAQFLELILDTSLTGIDNLKEALFNTDNADSEFKNIVGTFSLALYLSNTNATTDDRFHFTGINLRATQDDNRDTTLNGPSISSLNSLNYADTLSGISTTYLSIDATDIIANDNTLELSVSSGAQIAGYVVRQ